MKNLLLTLLATIFLSGCVLTTPRFDNVEYNRAVELTHSLDALKAGCQLPSNIFMEALGTVIWQADGFALYTKHLPGDQAVHSVAQNIKEDLVQIQERIADQRFNQKYCEIKIKITHKKAERIMEAMGQEIRN